MVASKDILKIIKTKEFSIFIGLLSLCLLLSISTDTFLTSYNMGIVIRQVSFIAIVALGQTLVLLTGGIDLSVGAIAGLSSILGALLMTSVGLNPFLSTFLGVGFGFIFGLINGIFIAKLRLNAFIVTLAFGEAFYGLILVITRGYPVLNLPKSFTILGQGMVGAIPVPVIIMVILTAIMIFILHSTPFGRNIYAIGGNKEAASLVGIKVQNSVMLIYALSGMFAALAGLLLTSRMNAGQPTIGASWVMPSVTAAIIGGTSLSGGEGTIIGTVIGATFMGVLANGIVLLNISSYWERVIIGMVVILAIVIDLFRNRKKFNS